MENKHERPSDEADVSWGVLPSTDEERERRADLEAEDARMGEGLLD